MNVIKYVSVVVTFNRKLLLVQAIQSLLKQNIPPEKIVIIDNHSTDGTEKLIKTTFKSDYEFLDYILLDENVGGSAGFGKGVQEALKYDVDWVSISDDDAIYHHDFFSNISDAIKNNPTVKVFTGSVSLPNGDLQLSHRRRITSAVTLKQVPVKKSEYTNNFYLDVFTFVGVVLNKELIKRIGFPEKDYFIWYDDTEYAMRSRKQTKIINVSNACIEHKVKLESNYKPSWKVYYGIRNRIITERKYTTNVFKFYIHNIALLGREIMGIFVKSKYKSFRLFLFKTYLNGFWDGFNHKMGKNKKYLPGMKIK